MMVLILGILGVTPSPKGTESAVLCEKRGHHTPVLLSGTSLGPTHNHPLHSVRAACPQLHFCVCLRTKPHPSSRNLSSRKWSRQRMSPMSPAPSPLGLGVGAAAIRQGDFLSFLSRAGAAGTAQPDAVWPLGRISADLLFCLATMLCLKLKK